MTDTPPPRSPDAVLDALVALGGAAEALRPTVPSWQVRTVEAGRPYVRRGQRAQAVLLVLEGELAVQMQKTDIGRLTGVAFTGLSSCITKEGTHPRDLLAVRRTVVAELPTEALLELRHGRDLAYRELLAIELRSLAQRMEATGARIATLRAGNVPLTHRERSSMLGRLWRSLRARGDSFPPIDPLLQALPGLRQARPEVIAEIGAAFRPRSFGPHDVIALEGEAEGSLFLLAAGQVDVLRKSTNGVGALMLTALREGAVFGMVSLLTTMKRSASCVAADEVKVYEMTREAHAGLAPDAARAWGESLMAVLHRQLGESYSSLVAALRLFESRGPATEKGAGADESLVMFVTSQRRPDDPGGDDPH